MMTTTERHPDIEIYLKGQPAERIEAWLQERLGPLRAGRRTRQGSHYQLEIDGQPVPVLVVEKAAGDFTSLWLNSDATPWLRDIDCAREANAYFQCEVRCIASGWRDSSWKSCARCRSRNRRWNNGCVAYPTIRVDCCGASFATSTNVVKWTRMATRCGPTTMCSLGKWQELIKCEAK